MRTAVTYHRVSTADQDPTLARGELERGAAARNLQVVEAIEETGSGARNDRPGLRRVLELVDQGAVTHVLVWKLDRFGRSALDLLANVERLKRAGATFIATSQGLQVGADAGALGALTLTVLAAVAEFERDMIRERTRLGHAKARANGVHIGRKPIPMTAMVVARAKALRAELPRKTGFRRRGGPRSWPAIARILKREGWGLFHPKTLSHAVSGKKEVQGYVPPVPPPWRAAPASLEAGKK